MILELQVQLKNWEQVEVLSKELITLRWVVVFLSRVIRHAQVL